MKKKMKKWRWKAFYGMFADSDLADFLNKGGVKEFVVTFADRDGLGIVYLVEEKDE